MQRLKAASDSKPKSFYYITCFNIYKGKHLDLLDLHFLCHTQATERSEKLVTVVSEVEYEHYRIYGFIRLRIGFCKIILHFHSKKRFLI